MIPTFSTALDTGYLVCCPTKHRKSECKGNACFKVIIHIWCKTSQYVTYFCSCCSRRRGRWSHPAGAGREGCRGFQLQCQQWQSHSARLLQYHHQDEPSLTLWLQMLEQSNNLTYLDQFCGPPMALLQSYELWGSPETCMSSWDRGERCLHSEQNQVSAGWCEICLSCL